ncbi:MAG: fatty acid cis/trans isomerase [Pirellulaceae bacterium]|nr:fatty acid cis/trans isomerase [Pirellulaceae bacterium]
MKSKLKIAVSLIGLTVLVAILCVVVVFWEVIDSRTSWKPFVFHQPSYPEKTGFDEGFYLNQVQPILDRRCIACHGCLDSPCLLKMTSYEGVLRGGLAKNPDASHLFAESPIRLNDAPSLSAWRKRGFCTVIDQEDPPEQRPGRSVLFRMLAAGATNNQPGFPLSPLEKVYNQVDAHVCPCSQNIDDYLAQRPAAGMPFGFPAISQQELEVFSRWIIAGAPGPSAGEMARKKASAHPEVIRQWEAFLNQEDQRSPLVSRYIYEHVFLATLTFAEAPGEFYRLVRSVTPPVPPNNFNGQSDSNQSPIQEIITARPFDSPYLDGVDKFYYRLQKVTSSCVQKSFFVWSLNDQARARLDELFYKTAWPDNKNTNPGYSSHNPFLVFEAIPTRSRSLFLLENSKLIASGMIRGPVCVGNIATYAIKDYFWVFFVDPDSDPSVKFPELGLKSWNDFMSYEIWKDAAYENAYAKTLDSYKPKGYSISDIWDGEKTNKNAWLTILRNETNATVMHGRKGGTPATFWLMDYSGFERLYYSLVADYTYWGSVEEKLATWEFMGYLRQEFEDNFLRLLPEKDRKAYRLKWTKGLGQELLFTMPFPGEAAKTAVAVDARDPLSGALTQLQRHLTEKVSGPPDLINAVRKTDISLKEPLKTTSDWVAAANRLTMKTHQNFTQYLPSVTFLRLDFPDHSEVYTLIANRSYAFNDVVFDENGARQPELDTLSIYHGLVGDFPNLLVRIPVGSASDLLSDLHAVASDKQWESWRQNYGTLRNSAEFWPLFDWFTDWNFQNRIPAAGHFDLRYYSLLGSEY